MSFHDRPIRLLGREGPLLLMWLAIVPLVACHARPAEPATARLNVFVSIPPQGYFLKRIGGDHIDVQVLVEPGQSHHTYEPTPRQVSKLAQAGVYFRIGVPFERGLLDKITAGFTSLEIIDTSQGVPTRAADAHEGHGHVEESGRDPHIWLSPKLVKIQASTISDALRRIDPAHADDYAQNLRTFLADLDALDARIARVLLPLKGREFFVFHPAYGYFGDAYGLKQVAVEEEGKEPSLKRVQMLIDRARSDGVKLIFVQPQFPTAGAKAIAEAIGGAVVPLDPMATDYLKNLEYMADQIATALPRRESTAPAAP